MIELQEMLKTAIELTSQQPMGCKFEIKKLFSGTEWDKLTAGEKRHLGIMYSNEYKNGKIKGIRKIENNKQHHNMYEKL